jgi:RND family efflux transporter MFP subunit
VRLEQTVLVTVTGDPRSYPGRVVRLSPAIAENNRTLLLEAEVPNPDQTLRPGTFATADIVVATAQPVVFVPTAAIVSFAGLEKVIVVQAGKTLEKRVRSGRRQGDQVEILDGLTAGETVVIEPGNLAGGQPVTIAG